jgi:hypothetical protein
MTEGRSHFFYGNHATRYLNERISLLQWSKGGGITKSYSPFFLATHHFIMVIMRQDI